MYCFLDPTNQGWFFRFLSPYRFWLYQLYPALSATNGKQDVLKQPETNTDLLYLLGLSYYKIPC